MLPKNMSQKGFSLVELLVVVAIIGVLAGVGIVGYDRYVENAKQKVFEQNVQTIIRAIDFEYTVISNSLSSALDEVDGDGNKTGNKISSDSTCEEFVRATKEHFADFKNPWFPTKRMVTINSKNHASQKKGMVQVICNRAGNLLSGWDCKVEQSLFYILAMNEDYVVGSTHSDTFEGGSATSGGIVNSRWYYRGLTKPPAAHRTVNHLPYVTQSIAQSEYCPEGSFIRSSGIEIESDVNY